MPTEIEATYRTATPMFCAGARPENAELRLPSFKGVLRFWWRAAAWSRMRGDLKRIRAEEDTLFGSTTTGQSLLSMRLDMTSTPPTIPKGQVLTVPHVPGSVPTGGGGSTRGRRGSRTGGGTVGEGARYLGYGVMEAFASRNTGKKAGQLMRACLRAPVDFTVRMRLRDPAVDRLESLEDALVCLGTLGGMGAKSRKGYGSLVIRSLLVDGEERWQIPETLTELCGSLLGRQPQPERQTDGLPAYTALSAGARHVLVATEREHAMELLDHVGRELMRYRSWGHNGKLLGQRSERNFPDDHDLMKGDGRGRHPRRVAFGLPHNYGSGRDKQVRPAGNLDRRASPLFIHVHECGDSPVGVLSFLPARFLPPGIDISVGRDRVRQAPEAELYQPIQEFLNRLLDPRKRKEPFTEVVEVP